MAVLSTVGSEFVVNTQTVGDQAYSRVVALANGGYVITWTDFGSGTLGDSSGSSVKAQIYDSSGTKIGSEFLVNTNTQSFQNVSHITALAGGGFVISWDDGSGTLGENDYGVKAQIFGTDGSKLGSEFLVNTQTINGQFSAKIAGLSSGGFVVTWMDFSGTLGDNDADSIKAQIYDASGSKVGSEFLVNTQTIGYQQSPSVTGLSNGTFVICWEDLYSTTNTRPSMKAQIFSNNGAMVGSEFSLDSGQGFPKLTALNNGNFVASWTDYGTSGLNDYANISVQLFDANGTKIGGKLTANGTLTGYQHSTTISSLPTGGFVVAWEDDGPTSNSAFSVKAQIFNEDGTKLGSEFQVGTFQPNNNNPNLQPVIAGLSDGGFVISWTGTAGAFGDGNGQSVNAQQFKLVLNSQTGGAANEWIIGGTGDDILSGGAGNDILDGGIGSDTASYADATAAVKVSLTLTTAQNTGGAGTDTLRNIENLEGSAFNDRLTGDAGTNILTGNAGNDTLDGGAGADVLKGGIGNDIYIVDNSADQVIENANEGTDTVNSSASFALSANIEKLILTGTGNIDGTGNDLANTITGNSGNNVLIGGLGNDTIDGRAGADSMRGDGGNDIFVVDDVADQVIENANEGTDTVKSSVTFALSANVEKLTLTGTGNIDGTGNNLANTLTGNGADNILSGGGANDILSGGAGNDTLIGGTGANKLTGGIGNDTFLFDILETSANKDTITDFVSGQDHIAIARSAFSAFAGDPAGVIDPVEFAVGTAATTASQHLIYNSGTGALYYDADGVGGAAQVQVAVLTGHPALAAGDIVLI